MSSRPASPGVSPLVTEEFSEESRLAYEELCRFRDGTPVPKLPCPPGRTAYPKLSPNTLKVFYRPADVPPPTRPQPTSSSEDPFGWFRGHPSMTMELMMREGLSRTDPSVRVWKASGVQHEFLFFFDRLVTEDGRALEFYASRRGQEILVDYFGTVRTRQSTPVSQALSFLLERIVTVTGVPERQVDPPAPAPSGPAAAALQRRRQNDAPQDAERANAGATIAGSRRARGANAGPSPLAAEERGQASWQDPVRRAAFMNDRRSMTGKETRYQLIEMWEYYHSRPRMMLTERPLLYSTAVLDRNSWLQPYCYAPLLFPCCTTNDLRKAYWEKAPRDGISGSSSGADSMADRRLTDGGSDDGVELVNVRMEMAAGHGRGDGNVVHVMGSSHASANPYSSSQDGDDNSGDVSDRRGPLMRRGAPGACRSQDFDMHGRTATSPSGCQEGCTHLLFRCFCLRCSIAQQTDMLFREEERRQRYPTRFCMEPLFGRDGEYTRTLWTMLLCDCLSGGLFIPCGLSYQGIGTACYGWRLRYLVRCRYRIYAYAFMDFARMLCLPMQAVDQQSLEMASQGLFESREVCYASQMR